ncbi:hypothetical protein [Paenibacillus naphthalenovorans]|uniref:Uncharacterized protein n=1 Tax=Paenibacillus naphthalenovorans TaxID=162209 RepID=A0A0U2W0V9_9BACL|nr:hypothetical protein [Paenibacillus naphthalenovorans]ALS22164.1 hypothetical protein IJ22_17900 [Paenibacillus naphthalenovorans]
MKTVIKLPKDCTCGGTIFTDSMCMPCLKQAEEKLLNKIDELQEQLDEYESSLDIIQWHIRNPICPGGCGENTAHCQCCEEEDEE